MAERIAAISFYILYSYAAAGILFAVAFLWRGVQKVDKQAHGSSLLFRFLLFPGSAVFWPLLLHRWLLAAGEPPEERNPHR
jgi:hypothetical protein